MKYIYLGLFFLALLILLLFYNFKYLPLQESLVKMTDENALWREQVAELKRRVEELERKDTAVYRISFNWDELFVDDASLKISEVGASQLKTAVPFLKEKGGAIKISSFGGAALPASLKKQYPDVHHFAFAKAYAVFSYLIGMGVPKERLMIVNFGAPSADKRNIIEITVALK